MCLRLCSRRLARGVCGSGQGPPRSLRPRAMGHTVRAAPSGHGAARRLRRRASAAPTATVSDAGRGALARPACSDRLRGSKARIPALGRRLSTAALVRRAVVASIRHDLLQREGVAPGGGGAQLSFAWSSARVPVGSGASSPRRDHSASVDVQVSRCSPGRSRPRRPGAVATMIDRHQSLLTAVQAVRNRFSPMVETIGRERVRTCVPRGSWRNGACPVQDVRFLQGHRPLRSSRGTRRCHPRARGRRRCRRSRARRIPLRLDGAHRRVGVGSRIRLTG